MGNKDTTTTARVATLVGVQIYFGARALLYFGSKKRSRDSAMESCQHWAEVPYKNHAFISCGNEAHPMVTRTLHASPQSPKECCNSPLATFGVLGRA